MIIFGTTTLVVSTLFRCVMVFNEEVIPPHVCVHSNMSSSAVRLQVLVSGFSSYRMVPDAQRALFGRPTDCSKSSRLGEQILEEETVSHPSHHLRGFLASLWYSHSAVTFLVFFPLALTVLKCCRIG